MSEDKRTAFRPSGFTKNGGIRLSRSAAIDMLGAFAASPTAAVAAIDFSGQTQQAEGTWNLRYDQSLGYLLEITFQFPDRSHDTSQVQTDLARLAIMPAVGRVVPVNTSVVRDAGKFILTGEFGSGQGRGRVNFRPDAIYPLYVRALGFTGPTPRDVLDLALFDVGRSFARSAKSDFPTITLQDLLAWGVMRISCDYASFLRRTVPGIVPMDVMKLRANGVTPNDVIRFTAASHGPLDAASLLKLKSEGNL